MIDSEFLQTAFRLDGLLAPAEESDEPWVFVEVQFQPDDGLYRRLFAEIFLYLHRAPKARPWRALVLYPDAGIERIPLGDASLLDLPEVQRVDLGALRGHERPTPGFLPHHIGLGLDHARGPLRRIHQHRESPCSRCGQAPGCTLLTLPDLPGRRATFLERPPFVGSRLGVDPVSLWSEVLVGA